MTTKKSDLPKDYTYRPLPDNLTLKKSAIEGLGLFATEDIEKGTTLGISHYNMLCTESIYDVDLMTLIYKDFAHGLLRTPLGGYINHNSESPTVVMENYDDCVYFFITSEDIKEGDELTINYNCTPCAPGGNQDGCPE